MKCYSELIQIPTFEERVRYLRLDGTVGVDTFGFDRYLNQAFYRDSAWKRVRRNVILRDNGGVRGERGGGTEAARAGGLHAGRV